MKLRISPPLIADLQAVFLPIASQNDDIGTY